MENIVTLLKNYNFGLNTVWDYFIAFIVFFGVLFVLKSIQSIIISRLKKLSKKTETAIDDTLISIFEDIKPPLYFVVAIYASIQYLSVGSFLGKIFTILFIFVIVYEVVRAGQKIVHYGLEVYVEMQKREGEGVNHSLVNAGKTMASVLLWSIGILLILSNLGVNITSLVASLGIGGIAVALAVQNILGDIFSSFTIYLDEPFQVGDFIVVGADSGTVEKIGLKTTRLRTLRGEELVIPNKELTSARIQNLKRMNSRRISFSITVVYDTDNGKLNIFPDIIKRVINNIDHLEFVRCHLAELSDSGSAFEIVYLVDTSDHNVFMDAKHKMNVDILSQLEENEINLAYTTQTIVVKK